MNPQLVLHMIASAPNIHPAFARAILGTPRICGQATDTHHGWRWLLWCNPSKPTATYRWSILDASDKERDSGGASSEDAARSQATDAIDRLLDQGRAAWDEKNTMDLYE